MVVVLEKNVADKQIENVIKHLEDFGFAVHKSTGVEQIVLGAIGVKPDFDIRKVKILDGVAEVYRITEPFKLASRSFKKENTEIKIKDVSIGGNEVVVIAGPCSVENEKQIFKIAEIVSQSGAKVLRGGAFKPRTSPYAFLSGPLRCSRHTATGRLPKRTRSSLAQSSMASGRCSSTRNSRLPSSAGCRQMSCLRSAQSIPANAAKSSVVLSAVMVATPRVLDLRERRACHLSVSVVSAKAL